jgi:transposase
MDEVRLGGRPVSPDRKALARLEAHLHRGKSQAECAAMFGVSVRTVGRLVARMRRGEK